MKKLSATNTLFYLSLYFALNMPAEATINTTTFTVNTNISPSCSVTANNLSFGTYNPFGGNLDATTTVYVTCTSTTTYNIALNPGATSGATVTTRQMTNGTSQINYALYQDTNRTINWGQTVGSDTVSGTGTGSAQPLTVYGRILGTQNTVTPGSYSDTITASVIY